jgi:glucokinase
LNASKATVLSHKNLDSRLKTKLPALGIDIGGTKMMAAVVNHEGMSGEPIKVPTPQGRDNILNTIVELAEKFRKEHSLSGIGIATAGIVNTETGTILGATGNLPGWTGTPIKKIIENKTMLPVHVENDANAAAFAEAQIKEFKDKACVVLLTIGTGIGGGILINGKLLRGQYYGAGHCGHIKLSMDKKRLCPCGLFDCFEAYASGSGLLVTAYEILANQSEHESSLVALANSKTLTNEAVLAAYIEKDTPASQIINLWHNHLAAGLSSLAHIFNPYCFILGGGLNSFIDLDVLTKLVQDITLPAIGEHIKIVRSEFGNTAGLIGAAQLLMESLMGPE